VCQLPLGRCPIWSGRPAGGRLERRQLQKRAISSGARLDGAPSAVADAEFHQPAGRFPGVRRSWRGPPCLGKATCAHARPQRCPARSLRPLSAATGRAPRASSRQQSYALLAQRWGGTPRRGQVSQAEQLFSAAIVAPTAKRAMSWVARGHQRSESKATRVASSLNDFTRRPRPLRPSQGPARTSAQLQQAASQGWLPPKPVAGGNRLGPQLLAARRDSCNSWPPW